MIFDIVRTGWLNLRRDRAAIVLTFILPIVFFSIFAGVFAGRRSTIPRIRLTIVDEDHTAAAQRLVAALDAEPALALRRDLLDATSAERAVRAGSVPVALIIPKGFGVTIPPRLRLVADTSDPVASQVVRGLLQKTMMIDGMKNGAQPSAGTPYISPVSLEVSDILGETKKNPVIAFYAAGIGVMFLLFTASNAGGAILEEHENGTLDRILSTRVTMSRLLLGKLAYLWTLAVTQLVVMFVWGALVFRLELMSHLAGFAIMTAATALACSTFGLLIASVARTRAQLGAISTLAVLTISALGGSMFPRFMMPEGVQKAGLILFNAWAIDGYTKVFWREEPLSSLVVPVLVLLGFGTLFFLTAVRLARRWDVA